MTLKPIYDKNQSKLIRNNVHVSVRMKPFLVPKEHSRDKETKIFRALNDHQLRQTISNEVMTFDKIYQDNLSTEEIFLDHYQHMIWQALDGYNVTIFAYG